MVVGDVDRSGVVIQRGEYAITLSHSVLTTHESEVSEEFGVCDGVIKVTNGVRSDCPLLL